MKIVLTGAVTGNGGDAAIMSAQLTSLGAAADGPVAFVVHDQRPATVLDRFSNVEAGPLAWDATIGPSGSNWTKPFRWRALATLLLAAGRLSRIWPGVGKLVPGGEVLTSYRGADLIVFTGGTSLVETYPLEPKFLDLRLALAVGRPLVLFTQSLGPFETRRHQRVMRRVARQSALIILRDNRSRDHLLRICKRTTHLTVLPDVVFGLADPIAVLQAAEPGHLELNSVAISVREWTHFRDGAAGSVAYVAALRALVNHLCERGIQVTFLSTCQGRNDYRTDDSAFALDVVSGLSDACRARVVVDRSSYAPTALREAFGTFDMVIATRMHAAILALCGGTPVLPISYEFKTRELFASLGFEHWVRDIDGLAVQDLVEALNVVERELPRRRADLFSAVMRQSTLASTASKLALAASRPALAAKK